MCKKSLYVFLFCLILDLVIIEAAASQTSNDPGLYFPPVLVLKSGDAPGALSSTTSDHYVAVAERAIYSEASSELLPIIFFDHAGSTSIPSRYQTFGSAFEASKFIDTGDLHSVQEIEIYRRILNVVGYRASRYFLSDNSLVSDRQRPICIELEGGYSSESGESPEVANLRAAEVRDYLIRVWQIDPSAIIILPPRLAADSTKGLLIQEEARRVTMRCFPESVLAPTCQPVVDISTHIRLDGWIDAKTAPDQVSSVDLAFFRGDSTLIRVDIPNDYVDGRIQFSGIWSLSTPMVLEMLTDPWNTELSMQALVYMKDGGTRQSNVVRFSLEFENRGRHPDALRLRDTFSIITIPFYEANAIIPTETQGRSLLSGVDSILTRLHSCPPGYIWMVRLSSSGDASELPGLSDGLIEAKIEAALGADYLRREQNDRVAQSSSLSLRTRDGRQIIEVGGFDRQIFEEPFLRFGNSFWYGYESVHADVRSYCDSIWTGRGAYVGAVLLELLRDYLSGPVPIAIPTAMEVSYARSQWDKDLTKGYAVRIGSTPEERFYSRKVRIIITRVPEATVAGAADY